MSVAVGFRVKSGWAVAVLISGPASAPAVVDRREVQLADPAVPESRQPFHPALELSAAEGARMTARLVEIVEQFAGQSLTELLRHYRDGHRLVGAAIVVGSDADPASIANDHIRAHAEEGRLFRLVIETALRNAGLRSAVMVEKRLFATAATALQRPEPELKQEVASLGRALGGRWRAEEKAAALAAWTTLA